jgi:hypothetical protein
LRRIVGSDSVRVTSLGKAAQESSHTDAYGRVWQERSWPIPFQDSVLLVMTLNTPEGPVGFYRRAPSSGLNLFRQLDERLLDYIYVTMDGTLTQWQDYLGQKSGRPKVFDAIKIDIDPERRVHVRSPRFDLEVTPPLVKLSKESVLRLEFTFFRDGTRVLWDLGGVAVGEAFREHNWAWFWRVSDPPATLPEDFQATWRKLGAHEFPYNSTTVTENGQTVITTDVPASADPVKVRYGLSVSHNGDQPLADMRQKLEVLQQSFKLLEQQPRG